MASPRDLPAILASVMSKAREETATGAIASLFHKPVIVDCRGMHFSEWDPELGYWVCTRCNLPLDEKRRPGGLEARWIR